MPFDAKKNKGTEPVKPADANREQSITENESKRQAAKPAANGDGAGYLGAVHSAMPKVAFEPLAQKSASGGQTPPANAQMDTRSDAKALPEGETTRPAVRGASATPGKPEAPPKQGQDGEETLPTLPKQGGKKRRDTVSAPVRAIGNIFYLLGFYAETRTVQIWRVMRDASIFLGQILAWLFGGLFGKLGSFFRAIGRDLLAPFRHLRSGVHNMRALAKEERKKGSGKLSHTMVSYFGRGVKNHAYVFGNLLRPLLPIGAAIVMAFTVHSVLSMQYALSVEVNGSHIGYVTDENVLEDAQNILRMKISLAENQTLDEWQFSAVVTLATTNNVSNKTQIADQILANSGNEIIEATGIYINDQLIGATTEGDRLREFLEQTKQQHYDPQYPDAVITFTEDVQVPGEQEVFLAESVQPYEELENKLTREVSPERTTVADGVQTLNEIAHVSGITPEELKTRNPALEEQELDYVPEAGTELLIKHAQPYLEVQSMVSSEITEEIPFERREELSDTKVEGFRYVVQEGVNGVQTVPCNLVFVNGEHVSTERLEDKIVIVQEPQDEVTQVGTRKMDAVGSGGNAGFFIFPVPTATYSSRGFIAGYHRGMDINGPIGTPIIAADGGTVVFAGSHSSYGNYVEIQHANGLHTLYAHCSSLNVTVGDVVGQGDLIAFVGSTGYSTGPHCHFEVIQDGVRIDPAAFVATPW